MRTTPNPRPNLPTDGRSEESLESLILRFEGLWLRGERPAIDDFVPAAREQRHELLVELVHAELELRLKAGEPARVEEYLRRFPELARRPEVHAALIAAEYRLRGRTDLGVSAEEYRRRFPGWEDQTLALEVNARPQASPGEVGAAETATANAATHPTAAGDTAGWPVVPGYDIAGEVGRGGMGVVYKANDRALKRTVALKIIQAGRDLKAEAGARFRTEAEAAARLQHPNIVQVHSILQSGGLPSLVLEFVSGVSLAERSRQRPLSVEEAVRLVATLADAIHYAHQQGVVHRDLKPANVLLQNVPLRPGERLAGVAARESLVPKITDFGLAKFLEADQGQTPSGAILGTPSYMAPEQARGKSKLTGPAADIYSLGAILYELLTGQPPFRGETVLDTLMQALSQPPVPPRRLNAAIPKGLERICLKCLEKDPARRYASAEALARDLRQFLFGAGMADEPYLPGLSARDVVGPGLRRRRLLLLAAIPALLLLVLALLSPLLRKPRKVAQALPEGAAQALPAPERGQPVRDNGPVKHRWFGLLSNVPADVAAQPQEARTPLQAILAQLKVKPRDRSHAGRKALVQRYLSVLEKLGELLRAKLPPAAANKFKVEVIRPACEAVYAEVIGPLCGREGRDALLAPDADAELKALVARLCAGAAGLIKAERAAWLEVKTIGKDPLEKAVELYDAAFRLTTAADTRAEYLVEKAFAYYTLPKASLGKLQEYAEEAMRIAPGYAGGYGLKGIARIYESRHRLDWGEKLRLLRDADSQLAEGLRHIGKLPKDKADSVSALLSQSLGSVCAELGNYAPSKAEKAKYLHRGEKYLKELLDRQPRNLEAWNAYAAILEDIGLFVGEEPKYYGKACDALEKAMDTNNLFAGRAKPWLARGRLRVRWAAMGGKEQETLLAKALDDLQQVIKFAEESETLGEAFYWGGKAYALHKNADRAIQEFDRALRVLRKVRSETWEEAVLNEWCTVALVEANASLADGDIRKAKKYADLTEDRARDLEKFSKTNAAWFIYNALRLHGFIRGEKAAPGSLLAALKRGLDGTRLQDRPMQAYLLCERARLYLDGTETEKNIPKAYQDAVAVLKLAEKFAVPADCQAGALGIVGEACLHYKDSYKYFPEAVEKLRAAVALAPANPRSWRWKGFLGAVLMDPKYNRDGQEPANVYEEAARNIAEAVESTPKSEVGARNYFNNIREKAEKVALPVLRKAVRANANAPEAWRWHWRLAEILHSSGADRAEALQHLRQAERQIPADAPTAHRLRIVALRTQLEKAQ